MIATLGDYYEEACAVVPRPAEEVIADRSGCFWNKSIPRMADGVVTRGGMWRHQRDWWDFDNFIGILVGGYGSGKTLALCKRATASALQNAPCPVAVVSPTFPVARQTTIATIASLLAGKETILGTRNFWWRYNASTHEFRIKYHGRSALIIVYSGDNPLSLRGPNLAGAYIDEPFIQEEEVFKQMIARVRHPEARNLEIRLSGTPEQLNWGYDLCKGELADKHDVGYLQADTDENLAVGEEYGKRLESALSDKEALAYKGGKFISLGTGLVYYAFSEEENVVKYPKPRGAELGVGMDFNVNPMAAVVFWRKDDHMHFFDEIELPNADTEYMCSHINDKYNAGGKVRVDTVYPDASGKARHTNAPGGKSDFTYIRAAGFSIDAPHQNPPIKDRYNAANGKFRARDGTVSATIEPTCKKLIKYMSTYNHENKNKTEQKRMSHLLDAASYPMARLFPVDRETLSVVKLGGT